MNKSLKYSSVNTFGIGGASVNRAGIDIALPFT